MFEKFTDRARRVVVLAQEEAKLLNHNFIGTEHILLGLIHEGEGVAAQALTAMGTTLDKVRAHVEEIIGKGPPPVTGHVPFTPRAKKVLELALREGLQLGHNYTGTEHILLGLVSEGEGVAAQVLVKQGVFLPALRDKVIEILGGPVAGAADPAALGVPETPTKDAPWTVTLLHELANETATIYASAIDLAEGFVRITPVDPKGALQIIPAWRLVSAIRGEQS